MKCTYVQFMTLRDALFEPMVEIVQYTRDMLTFFRVNRSTDLVLTCCTYIKPKNLAQKTEGAINELRIKPTNTTYYTKHKSISEYNQKKQILMCMQNKDRSAV